MIDFREKSIQILRFLHLAEQLKNELRHSWTSQGRQESVADHSWRMCLLLLVSAPYLTPQLDLLKALKMAIIHDIGEIIVGDLHAFQLMKNPILAQDKKVKESLAMKKIVEPLGEEGIELLNIWNEFEANQSIEARAVNFIDKIEACIQHNEADIQTWTVEEIEGIDEYFSALTPIEPFYQEIKKIIQLETSKKIDATYQGKE
ncbi:HD family hydrolase [Rhabdochlamydiaceae symbiont of Dictyostelium giganteum]|uniref:HD domain-containing protein n=1 Tax=Rhabdochlamydiaceae symbiont of Dictyostelium giganteum TaxID=3342349 RepID=UPI0038503BC6